MPATRRRHPVLRLLALAVPLLAIVAGAAVLGGNTLGRQWIEGLVRDRLAAETSLAAPPTVELRDRLVVWSVATQRFDEVHVVLPGLELKELGPGVRADVDLVLRNVTASERFTRYVAGSLTGSTRFSWAQVSAVVGQQITPAAGGRVALSYAFTIAGVKVTAQVSAKPDLDPAGALFLADPQVVVAGVQVPSAMVKQIADSLVKPVPLGLPQGIRATRVTAATEGLLIDLSGTDVDVTALR